MTISAIIVIEANLESKAVNVQDYCILLTKICEEKKT